MAKKEQPFNSYVPTSINTQVKPYFLSDCFFYTLYFFSSLIYFMLSSEIMYCWEVN